MRSHPFFFLASLAWNFGLGMTWLAVPLYAYAQGLSNAEIGILFAVPVLAQAPLNLVGGAYTDRIGGRRILLGSSVATIAAGLWFMVAHGFWMLLAGQIVFVLARAAFWPATWAMASELPGARGTQLGRLNAVTNFGQIVGTTLCGFMLAGAGFQPTFAVLALTGAVALVAGLWTQAQPPKPAPTRHVLAAYLPLLRQRIIAYTIMCAYLSALPFSLSMSFYPVLLAQYGYGEGASGILLALPFYPVLLAQYGYGEGASGILLALRAVGSILASLLAGRFVRTGPQTLWPVGCGMAVAASVGFLPAVNHVVPIAFWLLVVGAGTAAMTLYFQITISEASKPEERGSALALGGLGWSVSHLTTPLVMGFLADRYGIVTGFYVLGALALACAIAIALLRHWAFKRL